ncbi:hypothetical protein [Vitiosangium sp. GDMCC 1.1324]|uniref:hypothetical protein n=1 Tax=Vitiosangium sp. (strain GDMCC 1.1324) TaxID=2138576 RepID=UPI000D3850B1|nr:hypothetical protein [Vitiosangium sp. GDMCC 1.1324]PTL84575.1 hypothetical protein DAT35_05730 [Vitiosangium sp. GDMCC 1.1324]
MKNVKPAVLAAVFVTLGLLSGCGPATAPETGAPGTQPAVVGEVSQPICEMADCFTDSDCPPCPGSSVSCNGGVCESTPTGGGGGGGGGAYCEGADCIEDSDCVAYCHGTASPWCNNGVCAP